MIRTILVVSVLVASVLWLPLWLQAILFVLGIVATRYYGAILIPAIIADVLYAPDTLLGFAQLKMTLITSLCIGLYWIALTKTRLGEQYGRQT